MIDLNHIKIKVHEGDLPVEDIVPSAAVAVDTETLGLNLKRDRLCLVQLTFGDNVVHLVKVAKGQNSAPNLKKVLEDKDRIKIFHYGRFDMASLFHYLDIMATPVFCTRTASRIGRTYTQSHGLRDVCKELLHVNISKEQQSSYWGTNELSEAQKMYAAKDVVYLHALMDKLIHILVSEDRLELANSCFNFLEHRVYLDLAGFESEDIFAHH